MPTPSERAAMSSSSSAGGGLVRRRPGEDGRGDDALDQVVAAGEVARTPRGADDAGDEQLLERRLAVVPVPPRPLVADAALDVADGQRAAGPHLGEHHVEDGALVRGQGPCHLAAAMAIHPPAPQRQVGGRQDARHVRPVLEQLAGRHRVGDERARVRPEAGEQRQLVAAHEHVHRIDLDDADLVEHAPQVSAVDAAGGPRLGEALRGEGRCGAPHPPTFGAARWRPRRRWR